MSDGPELTPAPETRHDRAARRAAARRRRLIALGAVVVVVVVAVGAVLLLTGDDSDDDGSSAASRTTPADTNTESGGTETTAAPTTTTNDAQPLPSGVCRVGQLSAERAVAGIVVQTQTAIIAFTNTSQEPCRLNGVPGIVIVDGDADQPTVVTPGGGAVPAELVAQDVTLEPGAQASFFASWVSVAGPGSGDAGCSKGDGLRVAPPESNGDVHVDMRITACFGGSINVSPIQPGVIAAA